MVRFSRFLAAPSAPLTAGFAADLVSAFDMTIPRRAAIVDTANIYLVCYGP